MPHVIAPAPSGRAKCRACKGVIDKGALRLAESVPNAFGEGDASHFYHVACGAWRRPEAFLEALAGFDGDLADRDELSSAAETSQRHHRLRRLVRAERASSGRARCQGCRETIDKGALRIVLERIEDGMVSGAGFLHVGCVHRYAGAAHRASTSIDLSALAADDARAARAVLLEQEALPSVPPPPPDVSDDEAVSAGPSTSTE